MRLPKLLQIAPVVLLGAGSTELLAQSFYTGSTTSYVVPANRNNPGTEYSFWDVFYSPYITSVKDGVSYQDGYNYPDMAAPYGTGAVASESSLLAPKNSNPADPFAFFDIRNPTIAQTGIADSIIAQPTSGGNIYSSAGTSAFILSDTPDYSPASVNLQWQTDGTLIDISTLRLNYSVNGVAQTPLMPVAFISEFKATNSAYGFSFGNRASAQWDLTGKNVTSYNITWAGQGSSVSLQQVVLDTSSIFQEVTPGNRAFTAGGTSANWSTAANWAGSQVPTSRGNVAISAGNSLVVDGTSREVSLLTLSAPTSLAISATGSAKLQVNTGITANPSSAATYLISTPLTIGAFNLWEIGSNADLTISSAISGNAGFYKSGGGTLRLNNTVANSFVGQVAYDGGTTYISGASSYNSGTNIFSGKVILLGDAPASGAGVLGNASTTNQVILGGGGDGATLLTDGARTIGRQVILNNGLDVKSLGGQNTGAGAAYSGSVVMGATANNVELTAVGATDVVSFTGGLTGGGAVNTVTKRGAGLVNFDGAAKPYSYSSKLVVAEGTLQIKAGTTVTSPGSVTVQSGGTLLVQGALSGTGSPGLDVNGGTVGGVGTINRPVAVSAGGTLSPGSGIGKLTTNAETWSAGGRYKFELANGTGAAATGWDFLQINGALSLSLTGTQRFTIEVASLNGSNPGQPANVVAGSQYTWRFANATGGIIGFNAAAFVFDTTGFTGSGTWNVAQAGNDLVLNYAAVPEPASAALLAAGATLFGFRRRARAAA